MAINKGRVAIVTGAGQGIGHGVALRLADAGARVVLCDMNEETLNATVKEINDKGGEAIGVKGDVGMKEDVDRIVDAAIEKWGTVDILFNNAGINRDALIYKMTEQQFDDVIRINMKSQFLLMQAVCTHMREQGYGRIINISSSACRGNVGQVNYAATKAGINAMTWTAALEFARYGITVNSICPGVIDTPMARSVPEKVWDRWMAVIPCKRLGTPDDIAEAVLFFASESSGYINGQTIWVDGGMQTGLKM